MYVFPTEDFRVNDPTTSNLHASKSQYQLGGVALEVGE